MKRKSLFKAFLVFGILFMNFPAQAQEVYVASGGNAFGNGNIVSYSIGQITQNTLTGGNGSAFQGVQFFFPSSTLSIIDQDTHLNIATYPNPTSSILNLKIEGSQKKLTYQLYDLLGKLVASGSITDKVTEITIDHLPSSTYLLKIGQNNSLTKTFKIIKN